MDSHLIFVVHKLGIVLILMVLSFYRKFAPELPSVERTLFHNLEGQCFLFIRIVFLPQS